MIHIIRFFRKTKRSFEDEKYKKTWQSGIGIAVFVLFVVSSIFVNRIVQAINQSAGNYGYYGGTYGYNASVASSDYEPAAPGSLTCVATSLTTVVCYWSAPTLTTGGTSIATGGGEISSYTIRSSTSSISTCTGGTTGITSTNTTLSGLTASTLYYVAVCAVDNNYNTGTAATTTVTTVVSSGGGGGGIITPPADTTPPTNTSIIIASGAATTSTTAVTLTLAATDAIQMMISNDSAFTGVSWETYATTKNWTLSAGDGLKTVYAKFRDAAGNISTTVSDTITLSTTIQPPPSPTAETPITPITPTTPPPVDVISDVNSLVQKLGVVRNTAAETANSAKVGNSAKEFKVILDAASETIATNFVTYGVSIATVKLGSGERLALIRDQLETLGRVNITALEQLANGQKPTVRSLPKEQDQLGKVLTAFIKLTGHRPNFKDTKEDLAWNTMMYRVRFARDLNAERQGIVKFKALFNRIPTSPLDWAAVRAWGYALK